MKAKELIKRIKAGADVYAPISLNNGRDWQYAKLDKDSLLDDLKNDKFFSITDCHEAVGDFWLSIPNKH